MCKKTASLAAILALVVTSACDGTERGVLDPTPLGAGPTTVGIQPTIVTAQSVSQAFCPTVPPFVGSLALNVQATGNLGVSLTQVHMTFTDSAGITAPTITLPAPVLTQQFGSALVEARSQRTFPFTFPFGCGTRRTGTLVVIVVISDEKGRETTTEVRAGVR
jgi:hypothetical protein